MQLKSSAPQSAFADVGLAGREPAPAEAAAEAAGATPIPSEAATIILDDIYAVGAVLPTGEAQSHPVTVGDVLRDRFRLIELIGEGGMSRVYKATDSRRDAGALQDAYIAIKVFTRPFDEQTGSFSALQKEVQRLQTLDSPHIVRLFDCGLEGSTVFITMEYVEGDSLYLRLHTRAPAGEEAQSIITAVADALDHAHRHDVVHGDLKPGNVLITAGGQVKVIDFGIPCWTARLQGRAAAVTPRYASPQLMARQKPGAADDVYALACLAYELLTGRHPFDEGDARSVRFPPPHREGLTFAQYRALVHGLQFERRDRTATIREFMDEFASRKRRAGRFSAALWLTGAIVAVAGVLSYGRHFVTADSQSTADSPAPGLAPTLVLAPTPGLAPAPMLSAASPASSSVSATPGTVIRDCPDCPSMIVLPAGRFKQGSANGDRSASTFEKPQHWVIIHQPFAMATNDVTVADFREFAATTTRTMSGCDVYDGEWRMVPSAGWQAPGFAQTAIDPVTCTSWDDAVAYAQWLSAKTGHRYRLPSASEWEYAARAGAETPRPWDAGGTSACVNANVADQSAARRYPGWSVFACEDGFVHTAPVGSFKANAFGLNDMLGNVLQWTEDCWHDDYGGAPIDGSARITAGCTDHELRGASWFSVPSDVRASYRDHAAAGYRKSTIGFRLVRDTGP